VDQNIVVIVFVIIVVAAGIVIVFRVIGQKNGGSVKGELNTILGKGSIEASSPASNSEDGGNQLQIGGEVNVQDSVKSMGNQTQVGGKRNKQIRR